MNHTLLRTAFVTLTCGAGFTASLIAGELVLAKDVKVGGDLAARLALTEKRLASSPHTVEFPVGLRIEDGAGNDLSTLKSLSKEPYAAYLFHGPLLLGADTQRNAAMPDALRLTVAQVQTYRIADRPSPFAVQDAHYRVPSEIAGQTGETLLVPIAEFTGYGEWKDELSGFERNGGKPIIRPQVRTLQTLRLATK